MILNNISNLMVGSTQATKIYLGSTTIWEKKAQETIIDAEYITNDNVDEGYHMYINKNFNFDSTHLYNVETKFKWLNNSSNADTNRPLIILGLGKFVASVDVDGYKIYWHNSNNIYTTATTGNSGISGVSFKLQGDATTLHTASDTITGITNECYLTLFSNIRAYDKTMTNAQIYYVKIIDTTTNEVVCELLPKYDNINKCQCVLDTTNNEIYYFVTLGSTYRNESDLTKY